jgi:hypothetical protein
MVGQTPTELESANELILFDHMYFKLPVTTEEVVTTTVTTSDDELCHLDNGPTQPTTWDTVSSETMPSDISSTGNVDSIADDILDEFGNDDIASLANFDLLDFENLVDDFPGMTTAEPAPLAAVEQTPPGSRSPFMQMTDELNAADAAAMSPVLSSAGSPTPDSKNRDLPIDITDTLMDLPDLDWQESFTLFPALSI